jgi:hypothetical protein
MPLVKCENCNKEFNKKSAQIKKTNHNFCSHSCAASFNNRKHPKRSNEGFCSICGVVVPKRRRYCNNCLPNNIDWSEVSYMDIKARYKYQRNSRIRDLARTFYLKSDRPKRCAVCGYDKFFHVSHKKPVHTFPPETKISEINAMENLIALCPNHHWEFDKGLLILL